MQSLKTLFGNNLKAFRIDADMTQAELAKAIEKSLDLISQIERGISSPSFETIEDIAKALDRSPQDFFLGSEFIGSGKETEFLKLQSRLSKFSEDDIRWLEKVIAVVSNR